MIPSFGRLLMMLRIEGTMGALIFLLKLSKITNLVRMKYKGRWLCLVSSKEVPVGHGEAQFYATAWANPSLNSLGQFGCNSSQAIGWI